MADSFVSLFQLFGWFVGMAAMTALFGVIGWKLRIRHHRKRGSIPSYTGPKAVDVWIGLGIWVAFVAALFPLAFLLGIWNR